MVTHPIVSTHRRHFSQLVSFHVRQMGLGNFYSITGTRWPRRTGRRHMRRAESGALRARWIIRAPNRGVFCCKTPKRRHVRRPQVWLRMDRARTQ